MWIKLPGHPCWRVQKALDEADVPYEVVKERAPRHKRAETRQRTGQSLLPWLELEDGRALREESKQLARRIREGRLDEA
jgi:glutathione S-transferase